MRLKIARVESIHARRGKGKTNVQRGGKEFRMRRLWLALVLVVSALALVAAGCGGDERRPRPRPHPPSRLRRAPGGARPSRARSGGARSGRDGSGGARRARRVRRDLRRRSGRDREGPLRHSEPADRSGAAAGRDRRASQRADDPVDHRPRARVLEEQRLRHGNGRGADRRLRGADSARTSTGRRRRWSSSSRR